MQMRDESAEIHLSDLQEAQGDERDTLLQTIAEALTVYGVCIDEMLYEHLTAEWEDKRKA